MINTNDFVIENSILKKYKGFEKDVTIPDGVTSIGDRAFQNCGNLTNIIIGNSVTSIGNIAFDGCKNLKSVHIGDGVTSIGDSAFSSCENLTSVHIGENVTSIGDGAFGFCENLTSIAIPDGVTSIGDHAFWHCRCLTSITIPDSVISIGEEAFEFCENLLSIYIGRSVKRINEDAFSCCFNLRYICKPAEVTCVRKKMFEDCDNQQIITIPKDVISIGDGAFKECFDQTSITIPDGVTSIGDGAFYGFLNLRCINIPDSVTSIGDSAFENCFNLRNITIPENVIHIGDKAFENCNSLTSINIPDSVTTVGNGAFKFCNSLTSINIGRNTDSIGEEAFECCDSLTSITIPDNVIRIGDKAFENCKNLTSVHIGDGVTSIGDDAFSWCENLTSVHIGDGVSSIGDHAFTGCANLTSVHIGENVTSIGDEAFECCDSLTSITIPDGVTYIGDGAFRSCKCLTSITIPDGVTSIGNHTFIWCDKLTDVHIGENVTSIGNSAFFCCNNLASITIPDGVTSIGDEAFARCSKLRKIDIPKSLSYVGKDIFNRCDKLKKFNFVDGLPECFYPRVGDLYPLFKDNELKKYILNKTVWPKLDSGIQADIFINRHSETLIAAYKKCVDNPDVLGKTILKRFSGDHSSNALNIIELFQNTFSEKASAQILEQSNKASSLLKPGKAYYEIENIIKKNLKIDGDPIPWLDDLLKDLYYVSFSYFPEVIDIEGKPAPKSTMPYLFLYSKGTDQILKLLDQKSFQNALYILAEKYAEKYFRNSRYRPIPLADPICRYANESLMEELIRWCGKGSSCFDDFREAVLSSDTRAAVLFADKYGDLDEYARIRDTDADTIRNQFLSDVGLNEAGEKTYDLGNQTVTARLQKDLSFLFELPNGKIAKSLPKKGADEEKYSYASADFSEMKKKCKKIVKNQANSFFSDFLSGRARKADIWKNSYLKNPLLRQVASLVVWAQGNNTFTLTDSEVITSNGTSYTIGDEEITIAHPMEMASSDLNAWQKYFSTHGIKQPFEQIWEPVIDAKSVKEDRYKGCMIPYYRFLNKEKHGINVVDEDYHDSITITLSDCKANIYRIDYSRHSINVEDRFEINSITARPFTRKANHIIAYFDRVTIYDRIRKDDVGFINLLPHFTLAQITDFIKVATESNSTNVMAMLLDYKNKNFADFDPMEEFSLDF